MVRLFVLAGSVLLTKDSVRNQITVYVYSSSFDNIIGIYTSDDSVDESRLFICERHALADLMEGLKTPCSCGMSSNPWTVDSIIQLQEPGWGRMDDHSR